MSVGILLVPLIIMIIVYDLFMTNALICYLFNVYSNRVNTSVLNNYTCYTFLQNYYIMSRPTVQCRPDSKESIPLAGRHGDTQTNKPLKRDDWGLSKLLSRAN